MTVVKIKKQKSQNSVLWKENLGDSNGTLTHNHLACKRTLSHLAKLD